jgi:hypothetical protein
VVQHLESAQRDDSDEEVDEDTIIEHKAPPRQPDVDIATVDWLNKAEPEVDGGKIDEVSVYAMPYNENEDEHHEHHREGSDAEDKDRTHHRDSSDDDKKRKKHKKQKDGKERKGSTSSSSSSSDEEKKLKDSSQEDHNKHDKEEEFAEFEMPDGKHHVELKGERETGEVEEFTMPEHKVKDSSRHSSGTPALEL